LLVKSEESGKYRTDLSNLRCDSKGKSYSYAFFEKGDESHLLRK